MMMAGWVQLSCSADYYRQARTFSMTESHGSSPTSHAHTIPLTPLLSTPPPTHQEEYVSGEGTFVRDGFIYASLVGRKNIDGGEGGGEVRASCTPSTDLPVFYFYIYIFFYMCFFV